MQEVSINIDQNIAFLAKRTVARYGDREDLVSKVVEAVHRPITSRTANL